MEKADKLRLYEQIMWDYNISPEDVDAVLTGKKLMQVIIPVIHYL